MKKKIFLLLITILLFIAGCNKQENNQLLENEKIDKEINEEIKKVNIVDLESDTRPYAVVINNFPSAVKVHSGLQEAYIVYEFPIEGGMTRSLALYKDKEDVKIGTIRSARHDYLDYVLENDAIFVHFGWSHTAREHISQLKVNYIDGNSSDPSPFWRENPEGLATEHTVYTNLSKIIDYNKNVKGYRTTTAVKPSLKYTTEDIKLNEYNDSKVANSIELSYSGAFKVNFTYNTETGRYDRVVNGVAHTDYFTKKQYDCENIIVTLLDWGYVTDHADAAGNNYLDLYNVGTGKGYYITNGYTREITWSKQDRSSQTKYTYLDGTEVDVSDGNTWVMFQSNSQGVKIN